MTNEEYRKFIESFIKHYPRQGNDNLDAGNVDVIDDYDNQRFFAAQLATGCSSLREESQVFNFNNLTACGVPQGDWTVVVAKRAPKG